MISIPAAIGAVLAIVWGVHHPALGLLAALALVLLALGLIRFCREVAPALATASWGNPAAERPRWACPACGGPA
jgi:hypothetical protein